MSKRIDRDHKASNRTHQTQYTQQDSQLDDSNRNCSDFLMPTNFTNKITVRLTRNNCVIPTAPTDQIRRPEEQKPENQRFKNSQITNTTHLASDTRMR